MKPSLALRAQRNGGPLHRFRSLPRGTVLTVEVGPAAVLGALASESPLVMETMPIAGPMLLSPSDGSPPLLVLPTDPRGLRELAGGLP